MLIRVAKRGDPEQTASQKFSDLGLRCLTGLILACN